ncbi:response regulator [Thalassospira mesophila]|uniref:Chemotaxis protein CheY n=1 Tax=Thalassospira mesophila TaxID=1293891 RepID=A0A1Y2L070_9PROT|nr:response regulator [Thalassospira mesophila]OSQ38506.1 chemotaxis protein CheY [Thalassospira mesophila]
MAEIGSPHILVVDDDDRLRDLLKRYLGENGFMVTVARDAAEARARLEGLEFDLLVIDVLMPGERGVDLAKSLRDRGMKVPIMMLTALSETDDRIAGLEAGADDYLAKPFEPRELVLRIEAILRRYSVRPETGDIPEKAVSEVAFGDFRFDMDRMVLQRGGEHVYLTTAEQDLLVALAGRTGQTTTREQLFDLTGGSGSADPAASRSIDVQVTRLRRKLEDDPKQPRYLQTVRGRGYVLYTD